LTQAKKLIASGLTEAEAIERAKVGDAESFGALYALHKRRIYSLCLRMTGNAAEAEDLTQEAFLQLYRKIGTFRGESAFSTWLHRMAVNVVLMQLRKKGLQQISLEEAQEPQHEDGPKRDLGAQDNVLAGSIDRVNLERAVESLPRGYRIVFVLHDVEGYEHNEIAEMMGCSIGNSKSQLHKARLKLRDMLKLSRAEKAPRH
jgi:RNA polymerase sigma-70 factor (ECF subfamily)